MSGEPGQPLEYLDPLEELWDRMRRVLAPWGIQVDRAHLTLWREQARAGQGPIRRAEAGDARAIEALIALLRLLTDIPEAGDPSE